MKFQNTRDLGGRMIFRFLELPPGPGKTMEQKPQNPIRNGLPTKSSIKSQAMNQVWAQIEHFQTRKILTNVSSIPPFLAGICTNKTRKQCNNTSELRKGRSSPGKSEGNSQNGSKRRSRKAALQQAPGAGQNVVNQNVTAQNVSMFRGVTPCLLLSLPC